MNVLKTFTILMNSFGNLFNLSNAQHYLLKNIVQSGFLNQFYVGFEPCGMARSNFISLRVK
jgi:hypothetical protein